MHVCNEASDGPVRCDVPLTVPVKSEITPPARHAGRGLSRGLRPALPSWQRGEAYSSADGGATGSYLPPPVSLPSPSSTQVDLTLVGAQQWTDRPVVGQFAGDIRADPH